jgi:hypothetical protein
MEKEFRAYVELIEDMCLAQKSYFNAVFGSKEKADALKRSKQLEKEVDQYELPWKGQRQTNLFR